MRSPTPRPTDQPATNERFPVWLDVDSDNRTNLRLFLTQPVA